MTPEYQVAALWIGGPLSFLEQLCLISFVHAGQHIKLYTYEDVANVPPGVEVADANTILRQSGYLKHSKTGSPALHSDVFRYHLLTKCDRTIWADTDAYCVKPFTTANGHFYGWESWKHINGGVLGFPKDSDTLGRLLEHTADEYTIPTWYDDAYTRELQEAAAAGNPVHAADQPWGVWGPHALTHYLHETGEVKYALPPVALYPIHYKDRRKILRPNWDASECIKDETFSIHFYGRRMRRRLITNEGGFPRPRSLFGQLLKRHGIDPRLAPIPLKPGDPGFGRDDDDDSDD
ncbi:MAG: hypothetical protein WBP18_19665 [Paracoccaceae bacterium]